MIKFFNKDFFKQYATVFFLMVLLWIPSVFLFTAVEPPQNDWGALTPIIQNINNSHSPVLILFSFFLIFITGMFINKTASDYGLTGKTSTMPLFIFVLITGFSPSLHHFSQFTLVLPFAAIFYTLIFRHYHNANNIFLSFDAGIITGIMALFYFPLSLLIFILWLSLLSFKGVSWRNYTVVLPGFLFPLFLVYSYLFFMGREPAFFSLLQHKISIGFNTNIFRLSLNNGLLILLTVLIFISAVKVSQQQKNLTIQQRSYFSVMSFSLFLLLFIQLFLSKQFNSLLLLAPAGALTLSNLLNNSSVKSKWLNLLVAIIVLAVLINNYIPFLYAA